MLPPTSYKICQTGLVIFIFYFSQNVDVAIRKIAVLLQPDKDITENVDHFIIKTVSTFKNYDMDFVVGQEFEEDLGAVDGRKCMVSVPTSRSIYESLMMKRENWTLIKMFVCCCFQS